MKSPKRAALTCAGVTKRKSKFKPGDIVQIKTGSFAMTVTEIQHNGIVSTAHCQNGHIYRDRWNEAALIPARLTAPNKKRRDDDIPF